MRKTKPDELVICPLSRFATARPPESVFDTIDTDGKTKIAFGILGEHKHGYLNPVCKWGGLAVRIEKPSARFTI